MSEEELFGLMGGVTVFSTIFIAIFTLISFVFTFGITAIMLVSQWKIFVKMGLEGWRGIIPYYNAYIMFEKFWNKKMFIVFVVSTLIPAFSFIVMGAVVPIIALINSEVLFIIVSSIMFLIEGIICFGLLGMMVVFTIKMAHAFGKSTAFGVGLTFLSPVFFPILAFGKAQYIGPKA